MFYNFGIIKQPFGLGVHYFGGNVMVTGVIMSKLKEKG
jgi:hypothetical protein